MWICGWYEKNIKENKIMVGFFLSVLFYGLSLMYGGYFLGFLFDNDDIPNATKVLITIFLPIIAPLLLCVRLGMIILAKVKKETNRV